jgi:TolA-binding protein
LLNRTSVNSRRLIVAIVALPLCCPCNTALTYAGDAPGSAAPGTQELRLANCRPASAPVAVSVPDLPDDGPRFDRSFHGPESPLFEEVFVAYRCREAGKVDAALAKLSRDFPKSPLLAAALAIAAEMLVAGNNVPAEQRRDHSQMDAINAYRALIRDFPDSPNAHRAQWRIADLYALMEGRPEAQAAYEHVLARLEGGYDHDRALLGMAVNAIAWGRAKEGETALDSLRQRSIYERILRHATLALADLHAAQKQYREAQLLYDAAFARWPAFVKERPDSLLRYADVLSLLGEEGSARQLWITYVNLYPSLPGAPRVMIRLGDSYRAAGERGRAGMFYGTVMGRYPKTEGHDLARVRLAELGQELTEGLEAESIDALARSLTGKSDAPLLGEAERRQVYEEVAGRYKEQNLGGEALFKLAQHLERERDRPAALRAYKELMDREGRQADDPWPQSAAHRLFRLLSPQLAKAVITQDDVNTITLYHQFGPFRERLFGTHPLLVSLADAYRRVGLIPEAIKLYEGILSNTDLQSVHEAAMFGLGQSYLEQHDYLQARQVFGRYALRYPSGRWRAEALHARALAYAGEKDRTQAIATCRQWLDRHRSHPARVQVLLLMAGTLDQDGQTSEAIRTYQAAAEAGASHDPAALLRLADLLAKKKRDEEALARYEQVLAAGPDEEQATWARFQMARILRDHRRYGHARMVLKDLEQAPADSLAARMATAIRSDLPLAHANDGG